MFIETVWKCFEHICTRNYAKLAAKVFFISWPTKLTRVVKTLLQKQWVASQNHREDAKYFYIIKCKIH